MAYIKLSSHDCDNIIRLFEELEPNELSPSEKRTLSTIRQIQALQEIAFKEKPPAERRSRSRSKGTGSGGKD